MSLYGMRRANGDWFGIDDNGHLRMPIFKSSGAAMIARSYDTGMECFRPVAFDTHALEELKRTDSKAGLFLIVADPSRHMKHGSRLGFSELASLMTDFAKVEQKNGNNHRNSKP
jgi:hypothetical protein